MNDQYFILFANCIPVKGANRSLICDVQRNTFDLIPDDLHEVLNLTKLKSLSEIKTLYGEDNIATIDEYFDYLVEKEYGFWGTKEDLKQFSPLDLNWHSPYEITNAILDISDLTDYDLTPIISQLELLGCVDLQIRMFSKKSIEFLENTLNLFITKRIKSIQLLIHFDESIEEECFITLCNIHLRITSIIIHSAPFEKEIMVPGLRTYIYYSQKAITDASHCGQILPSYFSANIDLFTEAHLHNTCLNKKISVDIYGEIRNCPSMKASFGHVSTTTLAEALSKPQFKEYWNLSKDQIEVCKDCEFRYICTDCRAYIQDSNNFSSKPLKCNYDPYTSTWK
jgi:SPASM domain peptide maturase of grasp-with-spasm system